MSEKRFVQRSTRILALLVIGVLLGIWPCVGQAQGEPPPFQVIGVSPSNGNHTTPLNAIVHADFNDVVDLGSVSASTFTVRGSQTGVYDGTYSPGSVDFDPAQDFKPGEEIVVNLSSGLRSADGRPLTPYAWSFWAAALGGTGVFADSEQSLGSSLSTGMALGDLDGDGDLDAFVSNHIGQANRVWRNNGTGTYVDTGQTLGTSDSKAIALGDLDGDGDLDAFVANENSQADKVWLNDGTGNFDDSGQSLGTVRSYSVSLGDLDGDGDLDAFVGSPVHSSRVWMNDGSGAFLDSGQSLGVTYAYNIGLGDLDGDGDLDAFMPHAATNNGASQVWLNDGTGIFTDSGQDLGYSSSTRVALGDVDGDGDIDAFVTNFWGEPDELWLNDGTATFAKSSQSLGSTSSISVALGDLDGDGDLDAFVGKGVGGNAGSPNRVFINDGMGTFALTSQSLGSGQTNVVELGDLDGDGDLDAFAANYGQGHRVWLNHSDTDGDGDLDGFSTNYYGVSN